MFPLYLYNSLTRKKELFTPLRPPEVSLYTCGPTVYNYAHIGNLRTYVFEDILKRVLEFNEYKVKHVMNITDVGHLASDADTGEDKMEKGSKREGKTAWEVAKFYTKAFRADLKKLNILPPDIWCKATDYIPEQIDLVKHLEKLGKIYRLADGIYFDSSTFPKYAEFARLNLKGQQAGARVEVIEGKRNAWDFALWKFSYPNGRDFDPLPPKAGRQDDKSTRRQMEWESPWGLGFPGWHLECSAMSMKHLGETFDIHTGGIDHLPVHHTNEIAQSESVTGKPLARFWLHGEFLNINEGKMAKSGENFLTLAALIEKRIDPLAYRYLLLNAHYRQKLNFNWEALTSAETGLERLKTSINNLKLTPLHPDEKNTDKNVDLHKFSEAINDDMNMPAALAVVWEMVRSDQLSAKQKITFVKKADAVLGLKLLHFKNKLISIPVNIQKLVTERERARIKKDWQLSDELRKEIEERGYLIKDTPQGQKVTF